MVLSVCRFGGGREREPGWLYLLALNPPLRIVGERQVQAGLGHLPHHQRAGHLRAHRRQGLRIQGRHG